MIDYLLGLIIILSFLFLPIIILKYPISKTASRASLEDSETASSCTIVGRLLSSIFSNLKSILALFKENALVNPKDVFLSGQGRGLALKEEAQMTDVQQIQSPQIPPTTIELSKMLGEEINQIAGVSEELLGFDNKDTLSGFHSMLKQSASTTTLQILFDHLDRSIKLLGDRMA